MQTVFVNGEFVESARVSALDAGLQHGVGLFETMLGGSGAHGAWAHRLEDHLDRLVGSARELGLSERLRKAALAEAVLAVVDRHGEDRARVRLTITGGDLNLLTGRGGGGLDPTVLIVAQAPTEYPAAMFEGGVMASIADTRLSPLERMHGHKTLSYWGRLRELQAAAAKKAGEALVFSVTNHLCGGCVSNAFLVREGALWTPIARGEEAAGGLPSPVLPGIARLAVMEAAQRLGVAVQRRMVTIDDVLGADEVFLTNSSWGVLPVVGVERERIGGGAPGEVTRRLRAAWLDDLDQSD